VSPRCHEREEEQKEEEGPHGLKGSLAKELAAGRRREDGGVEAATAAAAAAADVSFHLLRTLGVEAAAACLVVWLSVCSEVRS